MKDDFNLNNLIEYPKQGILSKVISKSEKSEATFFCMAGGTEMDKHTSVREAFVFVIDGKGNFNLEGKNIEMLPNVIIHMKPNSVHSLNAEVNTSFLLLLVK